MRTSGWTWGIALALLAATACGDDGSSGGGGGGSDGGNGGGGGVVVEDQATLHDAFDAIGVDLASALGDLIDTGGIASANPTSCAVSGTISYDANTFTFTDCNLSGTTVNGKLGLVLAMPGPNYSVNLGSGQLVLSGDYTGTVDVASGLIQWQSPATDSNTYWEIRAGFPGATVCACSCGLCPQ